MIIAAAISGIRPAAAAAQNATRPASSVEITTGYAGFADEDLVNHFVIGGAGRVYLTPRVSVGPEFVYMIGPDTDRDLMVTGNLTFDFLRSGPDRPVVPFVVGGIGLFHHTNDFLDRTFSSTEGAFTAGGGARVSITDRWYVAPEFRIGWEPHVRATVSAGYRFTLHP
jgi:hypothetical protein